jgi:hypothetical protein
MYSSCQRIEWDRRGTQTAVELKSHCRKQSQFGACGSIKKVGGTRWKTGAAVTPEDSPSVD